MTMIQYNNYINEDPEEDDTSAPACWYEAQTRLLISLYKETKPLFEQGKLKTMKNVWERIKKGMLSKGFIYTERQLDNKWKSLERSYKMVLENRKKVGTKGRKHCPYERELVEVLEKRHSTVRVLETSLNDKYADTSSSESAATETNFKTRRRLNKKNSNILKELQELKKVIREANVTKADLKERKSQQGQEMLEQLKLKNSLLQKLLYKQN